jgi:hypothetical protein
VADVDMTIRVITTSEPFSGIFKNVDEDQLEKIFIIIQNDSFTL